MASRSLQSDPINSISDILRDGYRSGFPILKELIQNADDAKARRLVFGMHSGFQGQSKHPLLQCPGLWVFNDGVFTKKNDEAICSFGQSSKAGESGAIGKFGLGMKSVFHLCEAFFYVAFDGHQPFEVLLNPWKGRQADDSFHNSWNDDCPQDYDALRTIVEEHKLNKGCHSWFLLWIPLRRSEHVPQRDGKPYGGIVDKYPGDIGCNDLLSDNRLSSRIRSIVPLLKNLESIELASSDQIPVFKVQMALDKGAQRVDHTSDALVSTGNVTDGTAAKRKLRFYIQQRALLGIPPFCQFKNLNVWPKRQEYGVAVQDKSEAVGAILVSGASADGEEAKAFIDWAVFLPMDESMSYEAQLQKSMQQYRIVLHGQFFVDAGRRGIASFNHLAEPLVAPSPDLDDVDLHKGWNQAIAQQVILPQLLPTLAKFAESLNDSEKEELTRAIFSARSKGGHGVGKGFWELFRDFICKDQAWVRLITPGGLKWSHEKMTSTSRLLKLPPPPMHDIDRTWKVLPNLEKLTTGGTLLIDEQAPSLMRTHHDWDTQTLIDVLDGVDRDEVCQESGMSYLISFLCLEQSRYVNSSEVQRKLISIVRSMLQRESLQTFRSIRATFLKLVSLIKPEFRFALGRKTTNTANALNDITLKLLMGAEVAKLVLPGDLDPDKEDASIGSPNEGEVRNLLVVIDHEISRLDATVGTSSFNQVENFLYASQSILQKLNDKKDERGIAIRTNRSLRVLLATSKVDPEFETKV